MKKKGIQIAFAITLVLISIVGSIWKTELLGNIIYAVVIPSFLLSLISFVVEIAEKCEDNAKEFASLVSQNANLAKQLAEAKTKSYEQGFFDIPYVEGVVPKEITDLQLKTIEYYKEASAYKDVQIFSIKCQGICHKISVAGYVLLFLSLILSPYAVKLLSVIDLNCITLWSLTLLYFTLELKSEICSKLFRFLYNRYLKKVDKDLNKKFAIQEKDA